MFRILTLNNISSKGLNRFDREHYHVGDDLSHPEAIICRSYDLHDYAIPESVQIVGRAGAGVNNIPVNKLTEQGIPVLNTPGANANAVKELVITGLLLASRNICEAWDFSRRLEGNEESMSQQVEKNKKQFSGFELPGKIISVIGLGNIGVQVANAALALGMTVIGYDPSITVRNAWELSSEVKRADTLEEALMIGDFITLHVPLIPETTDLINLKRLYLMRKNSVLLNFAREGIVNNGDLLTALNEGRIHKYICDFPHPDFLKHPKIVCLPHLGASTAEAEENCAVMVADQVRAFLENGEIINSVNFPTVKMPHSDGYRLAIVNANVPKMVAQISTILSEKNFNIIDMINKSRDQIAYTLIDSDQPIENDVVQKLKSIPGIIRVRVLPAKLASQKGS
jgi:D-3-phosphoglycerate dehydrogenase